MLNALNIITNGYVLKFWMKPKLARFPDFVRIQGPSKRPSSGLLYPVSPELERNRKGRKHKVSWVLQSLVSSLQAQPKIETGHSPQQAQHFSRSSKMETPESVRASLIPGDWVSSIDLLDAYLHIPIHPASWKYLRFSHRSQLYQLQRLHIKVCEKCFLCHSIVLCPICNKCQTCCLKSACRGQTSKFLEKLVRTRGRSQNSSNSEGRLHPPLPEPAKSCKVSDCHKLLCESPQEQLPVGGITSAYRQKCSRAGPKPIISGVFQPTVFGSKTQQQMEANSGFKQAKPFPQSGEIQNGDTGNHQNIPPTRGVGHLSRFQRRLLPYTDTGTIQEISKISCPGPAVPVQSTALWSVHSAHGVHCVSKGGQIDGHTQGYKNPPVPRRLVSTSHISPNLSPAYPNPSPDVSGSRLASEFGKIRTRTQAGLRLCRLPV